MERFKLDPNFYKKYLDVGGITIVGSAKVADEAFYEARYLTSHVLAKRKDILDAMAKRNTRLIIIAYEEEVSEVPEYYRSDPASAAQQNRRVRGYGGATLTSFGEENLLCFPGDRYSAESIMIHEFGHCIDGNLRRMDPNWSRELNRIFNDARSRGLWDRTYSASNTAEYWAEGIQAYFDTCKRSRTGEPDGVHNQVGNRQELITYDPNLNNFIDKTLGHIEWRYTRYNVRHPEGPVETKGVTVRPADANSAGRRGRSMDANSTGRRGRGRAADANSSAIRGADRPAGTTTRQTTNQLQSPYCEEMQNIMPQASEQIQTATTEVIPAGIVLSPIPMSIMNRYNLNQDYYKDFYKKMISAQGVPITCSAKVSDAALVRANELFNNLLAGRPDVVKDMVNRRTRLLIIGANEEVSEVPDYYREDPVAAAYQNERVRGYGGNTTSFGEENVLCLPIDRYDDESIMIHEFGGHCIDSSLSRVDPNFRTRLSRLYKEAVAKGLYKLTYAGSNQSEYWAESVQNYFNCNRRNNWNHTFVHNREEMQAYDPNMSKFVGEMFNLTPAQDWRYKPLNKQPLVTTPPAKLKINPFYTKYLYCRSLPILGTANASDDAMYKANQLIRDMFTFRHDILKAMIDEGLQFIVLGDRERITDLPDFKGTNTSGRIYFKFTKENPRFVVGGEYILNPDKTGENLVVREFAKAIPLLVGSRPFDPNFARQRQRQQYEMYGLVQVDENFNKKLDELYKNAMSKGLWKGTPAAKDMVEYFAEGTQSWFDCNGKVVDASGKTINTRDELQKYDPDLAAFLLDTYRHPLHENFDWRAPLVVKKN